MNTSSQPHCEDALVSILAPVYNESQYIEEMLLSLQSQTCNSWEVIIVDDGSSDDTSEIVTRFAAADHRIRLAGDGQKIGKVRAFNTAYRHSRGDVICILGGDDRFPPNSVEMRRESILSAGLNKRTVAYFKIRTFSTESKFDGMILPRGTKSSRSGGSLTISRPLADVLFPIDESLSAEDVWLGRAADYLADQLKFSQEVCLDYRIHANNSNPRQRTFEVMNASMHSRQSAFQALLDSDRLNLPEVARADFALRAAAERARYEGNIRKLLTVSRLPIIDRLALCSMANPRLYRIRQKFYRQLSGLRGR